MLGLLFGPFPLVLFYLIGNTLFIVRRIANPQSSPPLRFQVAYLLLVIADWPSSTRRERCATLRAPACRSRQLKDDRVGQHSIRINGRYRVCFEWRNGDATNVEIVDYHSRRTAMTMKPPHPGETIEEVYLVPLGMSATGLAN
jgi:hypothetical protein